MPTFVAVDLGATSGRVVAVDVDAESIALDVVHRFPNGPIAAPDGGLHWDVDRLVEEVRHGLRAVVRRGAVASVAVDVWGVDYGLLDAAGERVGPVHSYRSPRTEGVMAGVVAALGRPRLYAITGTQFLPINTLYQLVAARPTAEYGAAAWLLMIPDLVNHALCDSVTNDVTDASTTQLLDVRTRTWSDELVAAVGLRRDLLPELHEPGTDLGSVDGVRVVAAASHDTASAVAGTPLAPDGTDAYISCGTWALVGCERLAPVTTDAALAANVTNELGVGGTVRLLKNVTGLWLLEECRRHWPGAGAPELVAEAAAVSGGRSVIDPDDIRFATPGDMPARIAAACAASGQPVPSTPAEITRVILDSLALSWRRAVTAVEDVAGIRAARIHLVGGGSAVTLLRRLCASACGRPVLAGPVEATVVGNAIVQAVAAGVLDDVAHGRRLVEQALPPVAVSPAPTLDWDELAGRL